MEPITIVGGFFAATGLGLGFGVGARLLRLGAKARRDLKQLKQGRDTRALERIADFDQQIERLARPDGRKRDSSIVGLYDNALRHMNGDYSCAWEAKLEPTMLAHDHTIETRCDGLARMLAVDKPPGTFIQFRFSSGPDPGRAILKHLDACGEGAHIHPEAFRLHASNLDFYETAAAAHRYRQCVLSVWARVPGRQKGDDMNTGLNAFIPRAFGEIRKRGWSGIPAALSRSWAETADDEVVRRLVSDEREARDKAEKVFRSIERECPLALRRLDRDKLWEAVYLGHRQDARSIPILPGLFGLDVRNYLCAETVLCEGNYVMHGGHPAAVVSMFTPPQPFITADALRALVFNPSLNFRHTIVVEFVYPDQRKTAKRLDRRIRQVRRTSIRGDGRVRQSPEARAALIDLETVRDHITGAREALIEMRFYVIVYAPPVYAFRGKKESLEFLDRACEQVITALRQNPGVEAAREEPESLQALYHKALVGEADSRPTGREITEIAGSLAALIPTESSWDGARRPHLLCSTPTGRLIGVDLFDRGANPSPLAIAVGATGSGKSVFVACIINSVLATLREARVRAVDFGESFGPHVDVLGGRHLRFNINDPRTINTWDFEGLERGEMPDEIQIALVVLELMLLARVKEDDSIAEDILTNLVTEVYRNEAPRNSPGRPKHEPTLSHLLALLESYPFENQLVRDRAATLALALEKYRGHQWIDAPTHPDFAAESSYDVYELDSLDNFPQDIREALAGRVASRVVRSIGQLKEDGTRTPTLLAFDEVWKIRDKYPRILDVIKRGARQGRKENVVTLLATQAYEDFEALYDVTKNAGVKIIGKQIGDYSKVAHDAGLSENAVAAVSAIRNVAGEYAQYVWVCGSGNDQIVEMIQMDLSPAELWTFTTNPNERNARARVSALRPDWSLAEVIEWLAAVYPRGLTAAGVVRPTLARQICLGLLIGILVTPTQTAQAQWTVFDPSQYALQVKKRLEEAERYVKMFDNAVKQYTTLKGVLEKTEDLVAKQRNAITTMSNIGRTVRGVYQLKEQFEAIVISRMGALKSINERLRKGIFDPEADMRDFEEYLRNSIGRSSQDTVANLQRLMKMDNQLKRVNDDLENARAGRAGAVLLKDEARNNRDAELAKLESDRCASCIANLNEQMANYDLLIAHYDSEIARLEYQVEERKKKYNIQMDERVKFGEQVQSMNKAWSRFNDSLDELQRTLSKY